MEILIKPLVLLSFTIPGFLSRLAGKLGVCFPSKNSWFKAPLIECQLPYVLR